MRRNNSAPGVDQTTLAEVEEYGVSRLLDELETDLKAGVYRPLPARRVFMATDLHKSSDQANALVPYPVES